MDFCKGGDVTVLDQGSNDGEVEAANFWGYLLGKVTAMGMFKKTLNVWEANGLDSKVKGFTPFLFRLAVATFFISPCMSTASRNKKGVNPFTLESKPSASRTFIFFLNIPIAVTLPGRYPQKLAASTSPSFDP